MSAATAVVSNDSGLMHVAAALNRPLVAVYGSTSPQFTPPLADRVEIVRLGLECSPCFERTCRYGHYNCLRELKPRPVIEALDRLVGEALTLVEGD
jgi:heptosyltransferase-2